MKKQKRVPDHTRVGERDRERSELDPASDADYTERSQLEIVPEED
jgi:hypothetical protein